METKLLFSENLIRTQILRQMCLNKVRGWRVCQLCRLGRIFDDFERWRRVNNEIFREHQV